MRLAFLFLAFSLICVTGYSDMVEIRDEGFFNGTIEWEDETQVIFKDADGRVRNLPRKDILFMERQNEAPSGQKVLQKAAPKTTTVPTIKNAAPLQKKVSVSGGADATGALRAMSKARASIRESNARVEQGLREGDAGLEKKRDSKKGHFSSL